MSTLNTETANKTPKTARGERTRRRLLDAAEREFGAHGFHATSIGEITRRAKVALGTFYVYFDSKDEIFRDLVAHMGQVTRAWIAERVANAANRLEVERQGTKAFIEFARAHTDLYRIVMEAQFVAPDAYRDYYESFAHGYQRNLDDAAERGEIRSGDSEILAWSLIGITVFLGMRFGVWDQSRSTDELADEVHELLKNGLAAK